MYKKFIIAAMFILVCVFAFGGCKINITDKKTTELTEYDKQILNYHRTPSNEEDFEDDRVLVILKNAFSGAENVSFADFKIADADKITYITNYITTIYAGTNDVLPLDTRNKNQIFEFGLTVHSKQFVLDIIKQLNSLDIVLVAEPAYIYLTEND